MNTPGLSPVLFGAICKTIGSICGVLLVVFVVLKLIGLVTWPWAWVLAPFWVPTALAVAAALTLLAFVGVTTSSWFVGGKG